MLPEGTVAPTETLPGVVADAFAQFTVPTSGRVTVLAFYPGDFSEPCTAEMESLRDMDLLDLDGVVDLYGVSTDTAFSHRRFADEYDLGFPLLSDNDGSFAESYGVLYDEYEGHRRLAKRAVYVLGPAGRVRYAWATDDPETLPPLEAVRAAVGAATDESAATGQYHEAHERFREGIEQADEAREIRAGGDFLNARRGFETAAETLAEAALRFRAAAQFTERAALREAAERAATRAEATGQAATGFATAADHSARGRGNDATELAADARERLESVADLTVTPPDDVAG